MTDNRISFYITGLFGFIFSLLMLIPAGVEFFTGKENLHVFLNSASFGAFVSFLIVVTSYTKKGEISHRSSFLATTMIWVKLTLLSAIPLYFANYNGYSITYIDAIFEASSGITTTGASILQNIDNSSKGVLLWRAMLQFFGGIGIITLVFIVMPYLKNGAMYFFLTESSEVYGKETPRIFDFVLLITLVYFVLFVLCSCLYYIFGMSFFDAICYSMSTVSSGGFGTHGWSFANFNTNLQIVAIIFMFISAMPFVVMVRIFTRRKITITSQVLAMTYFFTICIIALFIFYAINGKPFTLAQLKHIVFAVVSIGTSTGFSSIDFTHYGSFLVFILLIASAVGGCTGSTSGGIKMFRFQVMHQVLKQHFMKTLYQNIANKVKVEKMEISQVTITSIVMLFTFYIIFCLFGTLTLTMCNISLMESITTTVAILSNTGMISSEYGSSISVISQTPQTARLILSFLMILGRLEFIAVLVLIVQIFKKT